MGSFCARAFSSCGERGPLFTAVRGPLTVAASLVAEHRLQTRRLSSCVSRAQLLRGMWDPPRPGLEPMYPALAGRFSTTAPPGKPLLLIFCCVLIVIGERKKIVYYTFLFDSQINIMHCGFFLEFKGKRFISVHSAVLIRVQFCERQ